MTALVVGGTGFIGPRLIKKLVEQGEKVVCMDLNPSADLLSGWENEVEIIRGDVTQFEDVMRAVIETQPGPPDQPGLPVGRRGGQPPSRNSPEHSGHG